MSRPRAILTDIEGTTSSIAFVHDVLFPYALRALPGFVKHNVGDAAVRHWLDKAAMDIGGVVDDDCIVALLQDWIREDRKHPALKALQGMLW
jgi:enolase-phosphatase E1